MPQNRSLNSIDGFPSVPRWNRIAGLLLLLLGLCSFANGCASHIVSIPPPSLSQIRPVVRNSSSIAAGLVIDEELQGYKVAESAWNTISYTFLLGESLEKVIEESARISFERVVRIEGDKPWEQARKEGLDRLAVVSLENVVVDLESTGSLAVRGISNVRMTLRVQIYDPQGNLIDEKVLMGEGASNEPADFWGNPKYDTFTPGIRGALYNTGEKLTKYFSSLKRG